MRYTLPRSLSIIFCLLSSVFLLLPSPALAATLTLSPATGNYAKGCTFAVDVLLDTGGVETDGSDVILQYDPIQVTASNIVTGSIYSDFPGNTIDNTTGKVSIFALAPSAKGFTGKGTVATVNFVTSASASASLSAINFDFDLSNLTKTTDSNVIQRSDLKDVLSAASGGNYTIDLTQSSCKAATTNTVTSAGIGGGSEILPESGIAEPLMIVGGIGILLTLLGTFGLKRSAVQIRNPKHEIRNKF